MRCFFVFEMLVNLIFTIVSKIGDLILSPIVAGLSVLIPNFSLFMIYIIQWINYGMTYLLFFIKLLMIPYNCISIVVTVALASLSIMVIVRTYSLLVRIYNYFKP